MSVDLVKFWIQVICFPYFDVIPEPVDIQTWLIWYRNFTWTNCSRGFGFRESENLNIVKNLTWINCSRGFGFRESENLDIVENCGHI